jgi:hypothetical protein
MGLDELPLLILLGAGCVVGVGLGTLTRILGRRVRMRLLHGQITGSGFTIG